MTPGKVSPWVSACEGLQLVADLGELQIPASAVEGGRKENEKKKKHKQKGGMPSNERTTAVKIDYSEVS